MHQHRTQGRYTVAGTSSTGRNQVDTTYDDGPLGSFATRARLAAGSNPHDADLDQAWFTSRHVRAGAEEMEQLHDDIPRVGDPGGADGDGALPGAM